MNEAKQIADFVGSLGPSAILGIALYVLAKRYAQKEDELRVSYQARIDDSKANTQALLAIADRVNLALDKVEDIGRK